jgi:hypothetical protein
MAQILKPSEEGVLLGCPLHGRVRWQPQRGNDALHGGEYVLFG